VLRDLVVNDEQKGFRMMRDPSKNQTEHHPDPFMTASILNSFMTDRNPIQVLVGDIGHMIKVVTNLKKTRQLAQMRIDQLQQQVEKVEHNIATVNPQTVGTRLNKLR
jgi:hypothetical protein